MSKLTAKQIEVLSCVSKGEKPYAIWRKTLDALLRKGLITRTVVGYSITANGIDAIKQGGSPMTALNKQSLREAAEKALPAMQRLLMMPNDELFDEALLNVDGDVDASNAFNLLAGPETMLALLDELEAANELVELQRYKLERQAEDLHQAKSLESIHREKRLEVEREFRDYKDRAESNQMRLAKEVCHLEDELQAAGIGVKGE